MLQHFSVPNVLSIILMVTFLKYDANAGSEGFYFDSSQKVVIIRNLHVAGAPQSQSHYSSLTSLPATDFAMFLSRVLQHKSLKFQYRLDEEEYRLFLHEKTRLDLGDLRLGVLDLYSRGMGYIRMTNPKDIKDYDWPRRRTRVPTEAIEDALMARFRIDVGAVGILNYLKESAVWKKLDSRQKRDLKLFIDHIMINKFFHMAPPGDSKDAMASWNTTRMDNLIMALNYDFRNDIDAGTLFMVDLLQHLRRVDVLAFSALAVELKKHLGMQEKDRTMLYSVGFIDSKDAMEARERTSKYTSRGGLGFILATALGFVALDHYFPTWYMHLQNFDGTAFKSEGRWTIYAMGNALTAFLGQWTGEVAAFIKNRRQNLLNRDRRLSSAMSDEASPSLVNGLIEILEQQGPRTYKLCKEVML